VDRGDPDPDPQHCHKQYKNIAHFSKSAPSEKFALFLKTSLFFQKLRALLKILALCPKVPLFAQNLGALFKSSALCSKSWRFPPCQGKIC
jgi:hypothetical protein